MVLREFGSPVPAQTCIVSLGAMASIPIEMTRWLSKTGRQVTPLFVDFQMPPPAAAAKKVLDGDGMPVTSDTRPIVFAGPTLRQRNPATVVESSSNGLLAGACAWAAAAKSVAAIGKRCARVMAGGVGTWTAWRLKTYYVTQPPAAPNGWSLACLAGSRSVRGETHLQGFVQPYNRSAFSRITIRAISSARGRVISPSFIIPVSAIANASRADVVVCQPISSQSIGGDPGDRSVPNNTFSGYHSSQYRMLVLNSRVGRSHVCSEKSMKTFGFMSNAAIDWENGPAPPCNNTNLVPRNVASSSTGSSSSGFAPASSK